MLQVRHAKGASGTPTGRSESRCARRSAYRGKKQSVPCKGMDGDCRSPSSCPTWPALPSVRIGVPVCAYTHSSNLHCRSVACAFAFAALRVLASARQNLRKNSPPPSLTVIMHIRAYTRGSNVWISLSHASSAMRKPRASHVLVVAWSYSTWPCMETAAKTGRSARIRSQQQRADRSSRSHCAHELPAPRGRRASVGVCLRVT